MVQVAGLGSVQAPDRRIAGNDSIRAIAEPLQAAIPNISVNVIIGAWLHPKKLKMPQSGQDKPKDDNAPRKPWRGEELADRQEVRDAGNSQGSEKGRSTSIAPVA
jgi:hypothetical protein